MDRHDPAEEDSQRMSTRTAGDISRSFVGRERELGELRHAVAEAERGRGSVVAVTGEAGIGKTRLLQEVAQAAAPGSVVHSGRCWEEGGAPAYWPWIQVVRSAGGDFAEIARASAGATGEQANPESLRFALFDTVTRFLLADAAERPTLIVLEDLHAADEASLLLLRFLGQEIAAAPIAVLSTYRDGEPRVRELASVFAGVVRVARRLVLRGLSRDEVDAYVTAVLGEATTPALVTRLHSLTGGNPFFLGELVRGVDVDELTRWGGSEPAERALRLPEEVRAVIRRRIDRLSPEAATLLQLAAVAGRALDLAVLARVSGLSAHRLVEAVGQALEAGVIALGPDGQQHVFAHELFRETLYGDLSARRRAELHLELGSVLEELGGGDPDRHLTEIAHHLALAAPVGDANRTVGYLERAGDRAAAMLAYEEAARHYGRAVQVLADEDDRRRCELLLHVGDAEWRAGDVASARGSFERATAIARRIRESELLARAALGYVTALGGFLLYARFEVGATGADLLAEALDALPDEDTTLRVVLLSRLALELYSANEPVDRRIAVSDEAIAVARRLGDARGLVTALHARHWASTVPERVLDRLAHTEEMLAAAEQIADREMEFLAHNARFHCFLELGDGASLDREIDAMVGLAEAIRQPSYLWHMLCLRVVRAILDGRYGDAERLAADALELGRLRQSEYPTYVFRYAQRFAICWAKGTIGEYWPSVRAHGELFPWIPRWRDALVAAELGDVRTAHAELERYARDDFASLPRDGLWLLHVCALAECAVTVGDAERGERLYELLLPYAERNAVSYTQQPFGPVALRLGMLAMLAARWDDAEVHFRSASERCNVLGARGILPRILLEHARMLTARGDAAQAAVLLDEAASLAEELGQAGLLKRVVSRPASAVFRHEGDFWTIAYEGRMLRLRDMKGLRYLAVLLASPGREIHAVELAQVVDGVAAPVRVGGSSVPALDAQAKEAFRRRLAELGEELEEARGWADLERAERVEAEIDTLTAELAAAIGLGGRDRAGRSPAERARVSVTKAIRSAIRTIGAHSPPLASHLSAAVRTGQFCAYAPPGELPPRWEL